MIAPVLLPIRPDMSSLNQQIPGLTATVASPLFDAPTDQAEAVVNCCTNKDL